jgi:hypothetical protein
MKLNKDWPTISRYAFIVLSVAISIYFLLLAINALFVFIKLRSGFASVAGLFSIVIAGIVEMGFIVYMIEKYRTIIDRKIVIIRFLTILAVFGALFVLLQVFELWTFIPQIRQWGQYHSALWKVRNYLLFYGGAAVSVIAGISAILLKKQKRVG